MFSSIASMYWVSCCVMFYITFEFISQYNCAWSWSYMYVLVASCTIYNVNVLLSLLQVSFQFP